MGNLSYNGYGIEDDSRIGAARQIATISGSLDTDQRDSLGRLFATAPAMLKTLELASQTLNGFGELGFDVHDDLTAISAAIAQARGQA